MELTLEERKKLQYSLIMDDCTPNRVMSLSDGELVAAVVANQGVDYVLSIIGKSND